MSNENTALADAMTEAAEAETPTNSYTMNGAAGKMAEYQKQMEAMKDEMADQAVVEILATFRTCTPDKANGQGEMPSCSSNYLDALLAAAQWQALRRELPRAYMMVQKVTPDKVILADRMNRNEFRSDVERAATERTLEYYDVLEERLEELCWLISCAEHIYNEALVRQFDEDEKRQQDVPANERRYTNMPNLRWASNAMKSEHPTSWQDVDDKEAFRRQARSFISYDMNR